MWFDSHIHLSRLSSPASYIEKFAALGVSVTPDDWPELISLAQTKPTCHAAIGLHPWELHLYANKIDVVLADMEHMLTEYPFLAVGEIGLDFDPRTPAEKSLQLAFFEKCLALSQTYNRPLSLHLRACFEDAFQLLKQFSNLRGFLHGFGGGVHWADRLMPLGKFKIGVNGVICRTNARRYHALVRHVGLEHLVVETDGPYGRCPDVEGFTPNDVIRIGVQVAHLLDKPTETVEAVTYKNAMGMLCNESVG